MPQINDNPKNIYKFPKNLRLFLDYPDDLEMARQVFKEIGNDFDLDCLLDLFEKKPQLLEITKVAVKSWLENYQNKTLYLQSEDVLAESEIRINLLQFTNGIEKVQEVGTCENNSIIIKEGERGITQDNNCVFIEGKSEELLQLTDEFLFKLFEIEN